MNMRAKHYQLIAIALAGARRYGMDGVVYSGWREQWERDCRAIATVLERENPEKFDRARFLDLCGMPRDEQ